MNTNNPVIKLSWSDICGYSTEILRTLEVQKLQVETLVPILRGGLPLATLISHNINCLETSCIHIKRSLNENTNAEFMTPRLLGLTNKDALYQRNVLIVEDIIDKGITTSFARDVIKEYQPLSIKIATLINFPKNNNLDVIAGFNSNEDAWFIFPWEQKLYEKD